MEIIESDFRLKPISEDSPLFDLELLYTVKPRGGESRQELKISGYGLTLINALQKIAHYRVVNNHKEESISLKAYIKEYLENINNLKELING